MTHKPVFRIRWQHLAACLVGLLMWAVILSPAWAQHDCQGGHNCNDAGAGVVTIGDTVLTGGDTNNDSLGLGFAHALGDVDINDCLASTQWGTILVSKQKVVPNLWCMGEVYDAKGMFDLAAKARCSVSDIRAWFDSDLACETANKWNGLVPIRLPDGDTAGVVDDHIDEDEERDMRQAIDLADTIRRQDELEKRLNDERDARRRAVAQGVAAREQKRADDYEFAQHQLAQFAQIIEEPPTGNQ